MENGITAVRWLDGSEDIQEARALRVEVFCDEQGYSLEEELDELDKTARHLLLCGADGAMATGRLYADEEGRAHLGRIAVRKAFRGRGLGAVVVREMEREAARCGHTTACLSAQCRAAGFYEKQGYRQTGEPYMDGHVPHIFMEKTSIAVDKDSAIQ